MRFEVPGGRGRMTAGRPTTRESVDGSHVNISALEYGICLEV
jgi:hypothetical protein